MRPSFDCHARTRRLFFQLLRELFPERAVALDVPLAAHGLAAGTTLNAAVPDLTCSRQAIGLGNSRQNLGKFRC